MKPVFVPLLCKQYDKHVALAAPYLHTRVATEKIWRGIQISIDDIPQKKLRQSDVLCSLGTFFPNSTMGMHSTYCSMHTVCGVMQLSSRKDIEQLIQDLGNVVKQMVIQNRRHEIEQGVTIQQLEEPSTEEQRPEEPSTADS